MKRFTALLLIFALLLGTTIVSATDDTELMTYGELLKLSGLIQGTSKGLEEDKTITREEFVTILARLSMDKAGYTSFVPPAKSSFTDVSPSHWAYKNIEYAKATGITTGIGNNKFGLGQNISYRQAVIFLTRALGHSTEGIYAGDVLSTIASTYGIYYYAFGTELELILTRGQVFALLAVTLKEPTAEKYGSDTLYNALNFNAVLPSEDFIDMYYSLNISIPHKQGLQYYSIKPVVDYRNIDTEEWIQNSAKNAYREQTEFVTVANKVLKSKLEPSSISELSAITESIYYSSNDIYSDAYSYYAIISTNYLSLTPTNNKYGMHVSSSEGNAGSSFVDMTTYKTVIGEDTFFVINPTEIAYSNSLVKRYNALFIVQVRNGEVINTYGDTSFGVGMSSSN